MIVTLSSLKHVPNYLEIDLQSVGSDCLLFIKIVLGSIMPTALC